MLSLQEGATVLLCLVIAMQEAGFVELDLLYLSGVVIQTLARVRRI